jgi:hypothetical protein
MYIPIFAQEMNFLLHKLDRKKERQLIFNYRLQTIMNLNLKQNKNNTNIQVAFLLQLFFQQKTGLPICFPINDISFADIVLQAFHSTIPKKTMQIFQEMLTVAHKQKQDQDINQENLSIFEQVQTLVTAKSL